MGNKGTPAKGVGERKKRRAGTGHLQGLVPELRVDAVAVQAQGPQRTQASRIFFPAARQGAQV